jgi:hypothetical protein
MVNGLLFISLGTLYMTEDAVGSTDEKFVAFLRDEIDRTGCGVLCGVELFVLQQQLSKVN